MLLVGDIMYGSRCTEPIVAVTCFFHEDKRVTEYVTFSYLQTIDILNK